MLFDAAAIESLIPHCGESMLLDHVVAHDGEQTVTGIVVGDKPWLLGQAGTVAPWLAIEYMAQTIATHEGILARAEGREMPLGFLIAVADMALHAAELRAGEALEATTRMVRGRAALGVVSHACTLRRANGSGGGPLVAEGRLSIFISQQQQNK